MNNDIKEAIKNLQGYHDTLTRLGNEPAKHIGTALAALRTIEWLKWFTWGKRTEVPREAVLAKFEEFKETDK